MQPILETRNLTKVFHRGSLLARDRIVAVDNVTFSMQRGEVFTLAGESGCGKTTTARMILGFEQPTSGEIIYGKGEERWHPRVWFSQRIQAVFQNPFETFNPLRKVEGYLFETVNHYKLASSKAEAEELINSKLEAVGLSYGEVAGRYPSEFSGGQLQRISIARSLLVDPSVLIADEPVSMVDASIRMSIVNLFRRLRDELDMGILYITHDLATAYYLGGQIAIMFRGQHHGDGACAGGPHQSPPPLYPAAAGVHSRSGSREEMAGQNLHRRNGTRGVPEGRLQVCRQMSSGNGDLQEAGARAC